MFERPGCDQPLTCMSLRVPRAGTKYAGPTATKNRQTSGNVTSINQGVQRPSLPAGPHSATALPSHHSIYHEFGGPKDIRSRMFKEIEQDVPGRTINANRDIHGHPSPRVLHGVPGGHLWIEQLGVRGCCQCSMIPGPPESLAVRRDWGASTR